MNNIYIPVFGFGRTGGYRVLSKISSLLVDSGYDVYFITTDEKKPYYPTKAKIVKVNAKKSSKSFLQMVYNTIALRKKLAELKAGFVLPNQYLTMYSTLFLNNKHKRLYFIQAFEVNLVKGPLKRCLAFLSYLVPSVFICNSEKILPSYFRYKKQYFLSPGYDSEVFNAKGRLNSKVVKRPRIGFIARDERYKGTPEILQALSKAKDEGFEFDINIAIATPEIPKNLRDSYMHYSIANDVELADFYRLNDLFIATGLLEDGAFHYPCLESMASGCCVISNYAPLVETNSQFKIESVDASKIYSKVTDYLKSNRSSVGKEVKNYDDVLSSYQWESKRLQLLKIIVEETDVCEKEFS